MTPLRLPSGGFREDPSGQLVCPHRDLSCCGACVDAHAEIVEVVGAHFWITDPATLSALVAL